MSSPRGSLTAIAAELMLFARSPTGQMLIGVGRDHVLPFIQKQMAQSMQAKPMTEAERKKKADEDFVDVDLDGM